MGVFSFTILNIHDFVNVARPTGNSYTGGLAALKRNEGSSETFVYSHVLTCKSVLHTADRLKYHSLMLLLCLPSSSIFTDPLVCLYLPHLITVIILISCF